MVEKIGKIIERIGLAERTNMKSFTKNKCKGCGKLLDWQEYQKGLCVGCVTATTKDRDRHRLAQIKIDITNLLRKHGVPERYLNCSLDNFQTVDKGRKSVLKIIKEYVKKKPTTGEGLFLTGNNGVGKTHLMVAIMREFVLTGLSCQFTKVPELLLNIRDYIGKGGSEKDIIEKYKNYSYLFLDELGVEKVSEWVLQDLYLILDGRSGALKPTIITSNLGLEEIEEHIGSRFVSRIVEMCKSVVMEFEDWRLLTKRKELKRAE